VDVFIHLICEYIDDILDIKILFSSFGGRMFSQTAEYSLRAVACLARRPREPMTTRQIADAVRVPAGYLSKILQALARAGVVSGQRGVNGGFVLARRPEELSLLDVVRVADGSRRITACPLGLPEHGAGLCPLHRRLDDAVAQAEQALGGATIADVLAEPVEPLCGAGAGDAILRLSDVPANCTGGCAGDASARTLKARSA
jgi:Rrf2 family transcriptional regulator, nitric oxide-sensitive transcriptional repressor